MWTSTKHIDENARGSKNNKQETCAYRNDVRHKRQLAGQKQKTADGPSYVSLPAASAMEIYPY